MERNRSVSGYPMAGTGALKRLIVSPVGKALSRKAAKHGVPPMRKAAEGLARLLLSQIGISQESDNSLWDCSGVPSDMQNRAGKRKGHGARTVLGIVKSGKGVLKAASGPRAHVHSKLCSGLSEGREQVLALLASSVCGGKARSWDRAVKS